MSGGGPEDSLKVRFAAMPSPSHASESPCSSHQAATNNSTSVSDDNELFDPLANEAERKSMEHYDIYYQNERAKHSRGKLTFAIRYDYIHCMLMLNVIRAEGIEVKDQNRIPNPYIKCYLLPERHCYCKSRIHPRTVNPNFNEVFAFDAAVDSLSWRMLQLTMYDFERFKRHEIIGNVLMRDLFENSNPYCWTEYTMNIISNHTKDDFGELLLYLQLDKDEEKLQITVAKAYNLRPMDITGASDPYVKIIQLNGMKRVRTKKTTIKRANLHPVYYEHIALDVPRAAIDSTNLLIKVMDWDRIGRDDLLGCSIIGKDSPTEAGQEQWRRCVDQPKTSVGMWHSLLSDVPKQFLSIIK